MNKITIIFASLIIFLCFSGAIVSAQTSTDATSSDETSIVSELIETLKRQIESLKAQIQELVTKITLLKEQKGEIKETTKDYV